MFCLVREFLEYFNLDFTVSVYEPESYVGSFYKYEGREKIIEELGLKPTEENFSGPLLLHLLKLAQTKSKTLKINLTKETVSSVQVEENGHLSETENGHNLTPDSLQVSHNKSASPPDKLDSTYIKKDAENDDTFNGTSSIEEDVQNGKSDKSTEDSTTDQDSPKSEEKSKSKSDKLKSKLELPPLQLNKSRGSDLLPSLYSKDFKEKPNKEYDFEIKDDYEEDFMSGSEIELSGGKPLQSDNNKSSSTDNIETNLSVESGSNS